jgi:hypothetical protein
MRITHISPLSVAKVAFVLYGMIGLIVGGIIAIASLAGAGLYAASSGDRSGLLSAMFGVGAVIFLPLLYGFFGAIGALISTAIYNVVAGMVGGVELTIEPAPAVR